jgi:1-aminocyclopropane-1-carboxylate deaminase/D-cysteine desulfhydrase-like pyridoxal-dependent ACC family enzyme
MDREASFAPAFPRFPLATLPTPLDRAEGFERALRERGMASVPRIYLKRDDLLSLAMGGNKVRNLEFSIGQAIAEGATDVVTAGRAQSNHCRLTAAACAKAGMRAHLVMLGDEPATLEGNLLLDRLFGARTYFAGHDRAARERVVRDVAAAIERDDGRPFVIPVGGADARGAVGHALNALEIAAQCGAMGERPEAIVLATTTGGTQAGLLAGFAKLGAALKVIGFAVTEADLQTVVQRIACEAAELIGAPPSALGEVIVDRSQVGAGYGIPSKAGAAAIELMARSEGIVLDPVYTGKALAGLIECVRAGMFGTDASVVFLHTGGTPALFADLGPPQQ